MPSAVVITPRKIYTEDLAIGTGTDSVNVMGAGLCNLTKISEFSLNIGNRGYAIAAPANIAGVWTATFNLRTALNHQVTIANDTVMSTVTDSLLTNQVWVLSIYQDGTGGHTPSFDPAFFYASDKINSMVGGTAPNTLTIMQFIVIPGGLSVLAAQPVIGL